ncbi:MAG: hypothetical protein R3F59_03080 [Myxococcota bacterium]
MTAALTAIHRVAVARPTLALDADLAVVEQAEALLAAEIVRALQRTPGLSASAADGHADDALLREQWFVHRRDEVLSLDLDGRRLRLSRHPCAARPSTSTPSWAATPSATP